MITVIYLGFLGGYIALMYYYGTGDMSDLDVKGPYAVGARKFRTLKLIYGSEKLPGNDSMVGVFYPVDKKVHDRRAATKAPKWESFVFGKRRVEDAVRSMQWALTPKKEKGKCCKDAPVWLFRPFYFIQH